jgi:predicted transcriptional regulator
MRRSKMEMHLDILKTLAQKGPLKLTHIMYKANVNCSVLKQYLDFLTQQKLVEEKTLTKERIVYEITEKGLTVLKYFRELQIMLPVIAEDKTRIPPILY